MKPEHKANLLELASILDKVPLGNYCQREFGDGSCQTPACALGHWALHNGYKYNVYMDLGWKRLAKQHFGVSGYNYISLFGPFGCNRAATAKEAAAYIRNYVAEETLP